MPVPLRALAERGVVFDQPPFELGLNAFSNGSNVRFRDGGARRSSVLRTTRDFAAPLARSLFAFTPSSGFDRHFYGDENGLLWEVDPTNVVTARSPAGRVGASDLRPWTHDTLGDVLYVNRPTHVPAYYVSPNATFLNMPGWPTDQRARAVAASRDQLFAVNLTKGLTALPNTVAISDYALYGQPPATWDPLAAGVANEITLAGARSPLVGCLDLDGTMIVYAERQAWRFTFTGDTSNSAQNLWINEPLFVDRGLIAPRAVAYLDRRHFVFGADDLYMHDGVTRVSLADEAVRRWLFRNLDASKADRCFVTVDPTNDEVLFAFPSKDPDAAFPATLGCNRALVLTMSGDRPRWAPIDLPDVTGADASNFNPFLVWTNATTPWVSLGGSWADLSDGFARNMVFVAPGSPNSHLLALDEASTGRLPFPAFAADNPPAFAERVGIDLDELGVNLSAVKIVSTVFPELMVMLSQTTVRFRLGTSMMPQGPVTWGDWKTFDPATDYRVDFNRGGRFLALRFEMTDPVDFEWSGMDLDLKPGGNR